MESVFECWAGEPFSKRGEPLVDARCDETRSAYFEIQRVSELYTLFGIPSRSYDLMGGEDRRFVRVEQQGPHWIVSAFAWGGA